MYSIWMLVFCRASLDSLAPPSKKKAQTEGEDTEEDVEEQKVSLVTCYQYDYDMIKN